jgi:hypothetical protein
MSEQHELYEYARSRVRKKKWLYMHFVIYLLGSLFFYVSNKILDYGIGYDWYKAGILVWGFLWLFHAVNVFVVHRFMGKEWERKQTDRLIEKQRQGIEILERKLKENSEIGSSDSDDPKNINP